MKLFLILSISTLLTQGCIYSSAQLIINSYLSEKREKNSDLRCLKCTQDCSSLKSTLQDLPQDEEAMLGRQESLIPENFHHFLQTPILPPFPSHLESMIIGMGCFWGVERLFYKQPGVFSTAVGYAAGITPNPNYEEVYTGFTGHTEVVLIVYDPRVTSYSKMLKVFWENHNPTQGMQQGEDLGTQYRSVLMPLNPVQQELAISSRTLFQKELFKGGFGQVTTRVIPATSFYYAETYHQQYLSKRPAGYCGISGTGIKLPKSFSE
jgi:peptide-methionine (S)-S-oxide reductase